MPIEYTYTYNKENVKFLDDLHMYVLQVDALPSQFYINASSHIDIIFTQELSSEQLNILNNIINEYVPPQELHIPFINETILITNPVISTNTYSVIGTYFYSIANLQTDVFISSFTIIASVKGNISYKIRIYDAINDNLLCETNSLNNTNLQIIKITNLSNIPSNDTLLEIQGLVSGDNTCNVKLVQINFSKRQF